MFLWQGVADSNPEAYLQNLCSTSDTYWSSRRPDNLLLQTEKIFRMILWREIHPFGMASGHFPPSSMRRTSFYASGRTRRSLCIVKVPDGWCVLPRIRPIPLNISNELNYYM
jgi:hypothetical protein